MQYALSAIERIVKEHEETLEKIRGLDVITRHFESLRQSWTPGRPREVAQELARLEEALAIIRTDLEKHMRFEEDEFLPTLTEYAADIVSRGVLFEHRGIIESIANLREHARAMVGKPANREELLMKESKIKEAINDIQKLLEEHVQTSEVIYKLARETLAQGSKPTARSNQNAKG